MKTKVIYLITAGLLITACLPTRTAAPIIETPSAAAPAVSSTEAISPSPTMTSSPTEAVNTPPQPTRTTVPTSTSQPTSPPTETPTENVTAQITPTLSAASGTSTALIADHTVIDQFLNIPDEYIQAASQLTLLFRHASVGANIDMGLNCLMGNFEGRRPNICDRSLLPGQVIIDPKYDRSNWTLEFHLPPPDQNPGWWNKVSLFVDRINNLGPDEKYDVAGFKFGYVDAVTGSELPALFFHNSETDEYPSIEDLEALEAQHPDIKFMYWTLALSKSIGTEEAASFNQQLREYALTHNKILMDIADIESHLPDGTPCTDVDGNGYEALCGDYTREARGGHLDSQGSQRMAKALWWMMARLAGWDGSS